MLKKTYKGTIGTKEFFIELSDSYSAILDDLGFEATTAASFVAGDLVSSHKALEAGGIIGQLTLGLEGKKRAKCFISSDKIAGRSNLVGKSYGGKAIKSVSVRAYTKLV